MKPKNTICIWFDKEAEEAAGFTPRPFRTVKSRPFTRPPVTIRAARRGR